MTRLEMISPDFELHFRPRSLSWNANVQKEIDDVWAEEKKRLGDRLTNGSLLSLSPQGDFAFSIEYKVFLAQLRRPKLFDVFGVRPLGVSGILRLDQEVVIGKRSTLLVNYPGLWELMPSGGLDSSVVKADACIDYRLQILNELEEESGLSRLDVVEVKPVALLEDTENHICDIAMELKLSLSKTQLLEKLSMHLDKSEYTEFRLLTPHAASIEAERSPNDWVCSTRALLKTL